MKRSAVRCENLTKTFGEITAVEDVSFDLERGDILALVGPSGCGKTTLLRLIAGFGVPDRGEVYVGGEPVVDERKFVPPEKRDVGIVFQNYALFPHLDVSENIAYGLSSKSVQREKRVGEMLTLIGLEECGSKMPHELSGGEQQRVALARALAPDPEILLLDEPFSNLDADLRTRIRSEVRDILKRTEASVVFVTHDQDEALFMGDRVGVMNEGKLVQVDRPEDIFHYPENPFVGEFIGTADFIDGKINGDETVETEMGNLRYHGTFPSGKSVDVMIRPDFMDIEPVDGGVGEIVDRIYRGMHYLYKIRLPSGLTVRTLQHHTEKYELGTNVTFNLDPEHEVICFPER